MTMRTNKEKAPEGAFRKILPTYIRLATFCRYNDIRLVELLKLNADRLYRSRFFNGLNMTRRSRSLKHLKKYIEWSSKAYVIIHRNSLSALRC